MKQAKNCSNCIRIKTWWNQSLQKVTYKELYEIKTCEKSKLFDNIADVIADIVTEIVDIVEAILKIDAF